MTVSYREMQTTPPEWRWGWVVRRVLGHAAWALAIMAAGALCSRVARVIAHEVAEDSRVQREHEGAQRRGRIAACVARGGTWNEGDVGGRLSEWCSGVRR